ncbi:MAG: ABC transporter permease [Candidatus Hecatellaceae archaeon]
MGARYLFLIARRILFKRKTSALTASMAVAATIFLISFNGVVLGGVISGVERDLATFQYGNLEILNEKEGVIDKPDYQLVASVTRHPLVEAAAPRVLALAAEVSHQTPNRTYTVYNVTVVGVDPFLEPKASQIFNSVAAGKPQLHKSTVLVGRDLAEDLGLEGAEGLLKVKIRRVTGEEVSKNVMVSGIVVSSAAGGLNHILIFHIDQLRELLGWKQRYSTSLVVKLSQPERADEVAAWIKMQYPDYQVKTPREAAKNWLNAIIEGVSFINLVGYAGMIASALAVITVLTMMVSGKTRDIGVLRALGVSRKSVILLFIFDGVLIGLIGAAIGGLVSSLVALWLENYPVAFFGNLVLEVRFSPLNLVFPMIVGFIISVLASIYPAWKASTYEPAEAMRYF